MLLQPMLQLFLEFTYLQYKDKTCNTSQLNIQLVKKLFGMGKCKKRILNKNTDMRGGVFKRAEIIRKIISDIRTNSITNKTMEFITLFGITPEELSEAGASYEELSAVKHLIF